MKNIFLIFAFSLIGLSAQAQISIDTVRVEGLRICDGSRGLLDPCYSYFEIFPENFCKDDTVTARAITISGLGPYTYNWSNGATTATVKIVSSNTISLNCTVTDITDCSVTNSQPITSVMNPSPSVSISVIGEPCYRIFVANTANCNDIFWSNGNMGPVAEVALGTNFISVTTENSYGCTAFDTMSVNSAQCPKDTITKIITVYADTLYLNCDTTVNEVMPVASFTATNKKGCGPLVVHFFNASLNETSVEWSFPGGEPSSSTEENPTVTYEFEGLYNVTLVARNNSGSNSLQAPGLVDVEGEAPKITVSVNKPVISPGEFVVLSVSVNGNSNYSYSWDHASTLNWPNHQNPIATPATTTTYGVTVVDLATGCASTGYVTVIVLGTTANQELDPNLFEVISSLGSNEIYIKSNLKDYHTVLFDVSGRIVKSQKCNEVETIVSTNDLASGQYFLTIFWGNKAYVKPIAIVN